MKWFKKKEKSFQERMMEDWGNKEIYGPWSKPEDMIDEKGLPKMFKDFYLVTDNRPCNLSLYEPLTDEGIIQQEEDDIKYLEWIQQQKKKL